MINPPRTAFFGALSACAELDSGGAVTAGAIAGVGPDDAETTKARPKFDRQIFQQGKAYDLLLGVPLIYWFGYVNGVRLSPFLLGYARDVWAQPDNLLFNLRLFAMSTSIAFNLLTVCLIVIRTSPVRRSSGWLPRALGFAGTFFGISLLYLKPAALSLNWQILASVLILSGSLGSIIVMSKLGRSFSIMPDARNLVTDGPYAVARHPLYAVELVNIAGVTILFEHAWACILSLIVLLLLIARSYCEEQVLTAAYPEYVLYRKRVKRFGFV